MMDLLVQFQCIFYSFVFGFVMSGFYHVLNRILYRIFPLIRVLFQIVIGVGFGMVYFGGLVFFNDGVLRFYFFIFLFLGYLFYSKYYAYYWLCVLEKVVYFIKRILAPFIFFFHKINVIIQKRVKKVRLKWQKDNQNIKSS